MKRGRYITLEGVEGVGKTTVQQRLVAALRARGHEVVAVREPGGTAVGEGIRSLLLEGDSMGAWTEALLFAAQRSQLAQEVIAPALRRGAWVVGDRSVYSSLAYQGGGRGLGLAAVETVNRAGLGGVWPDLAVLLRLAPEHGLARQDGADRIGAEGIDFLARVAAAFDRLAAQEPERWVVVPADRPLPQVIEDVVAAVTERW